MQRATEIFSRAILGTRAIVSLALLYHIFTAGKNC
jgi:hypothetical protein